ncbi:NAD-dependent dihydropyrimidine dehydrogenase PreA subunit [Desulfobaculum xiamenense]|uniref:NAD-dependent dihydropyrimidine dehydrogenase PreA subunit n=1 Tax=Desulfobaculum xiamenense TaxID=995050 RepID=A0A846QI97_9BACT|nr:mercury methylation ferredoxin HgcB [Desulfobaculum xiamenense]NJB67911.1 NAD-dependent dihydropyrimidine dehydrogenase PreA subunit [Desulfobaculum xiamenense]
MEGFRYIPGVVSLEFDEKACVGCGLCIQVCPHRVFELVAGRARMRDRDACIECGACALNCPPEAIRVTPGVGCAAHIIKSWLATLGLCRSSSSCC